MMKASKKPRRCGQRLVGTFAALILSAAVVATAAVPSGATATTRQDDTSHAERCSIMDASISLGAAALVTIFVPGAKVSATSVPAAVERAKASPDPALAPYAQMVESLVVLYTEVCM